MTFTAGKTSMSSVSPISAFIGLHLHYFFSSNVSSVSIYVPIYLSNLFFFFKFNLLAAYCPPLLSPQLALHVLCKECAYKRYFYLAA